MSNDGLSDTRLRNRLFTYAVLAAGMTAICGCGDYGTELPNNYRLVRTNAYSVQIFYPRDMQDPEKSGLAVPPKIVAIGCHENIVCGIVEAAPNSENADSSVPGHFILDTNTGDVFLGMDQPAYLEKLASLGIQHAPRLSRNLRPFRCK